MAVEKEFLEHFQKETDLLRNLHTEVGKAIGRADKRIEQMLQGQSMEQVFGPKPPKPGSPAAQGGG